MLLVTDGIDVLIVMDSTDGIGLFRSKARRTDLVGPTLECP